MTAGPQSKDRVLVTGGAGFLGCHLVKSLLRSGCHVIVLDKDCSRLADIEFHPKLEIIHGNVTDPFSDHIHATHIYHLACPASPKQFPLQPLSILQTCYIGTLNALTAAHKWNSRILLASTSEIYGNPLVSPQPETYFGNVNSFGPRSCYDEGKRVAEALAFAYQHQYGVDVRIARIFNVYGPGMPASDGRVVCSFVGAAVEGRDLVVKGNGTATRCFQFVEDCVEGLRGLMRSEWREGPVNVGSETETMIGELARLVVERVAERWKDRRSKIVYEDAVQDDPWRRKPDCSLARKVLGWEPRVSLVEGIDRTIEWFLEHEREAVESES